MPDKHGSISSHVRSLTHALNHHLLRPNPPLGVDAGGLSILFGAPKEALVILEESGHQRNAHTIYYAYLHLAITTARDELGDELTAWRDAVGMEMGEGARPQERAREEERGTRTVFLLYDYEAMKILGRRILGVILRFLCHIGVEYKWYKDRTSTRHIRDSKQRLPSSRFLML
ncbi:hypothetical protein C8J56DRAFT_1164122 [Mycena floridula]|nr:hypothetical protein C8J56DRAFT_1164122 [Mycena floridula]